MTDILIKGKGRAKFPDDMTAGEVLSFLQRKYQNEMDHGLRQQRLNEQKANLEVITSPVKQYLGEIGATGIGLNALIQQDLDDK